MTISSFDTREKFEIQAYGKDQNIDKNTHIPFSGSPRKHPYDPERFILVADPFTDNTFYYEFKIADIGFAEELPNMTNINGEAVPMARIWVVKQSVGIRSTPFVVDHISV
ncbi:MAG: inorganic pyrophosphatase Ppa [Desulfobacter sp.]|nr:inorganic pyrophosphatase Ppa [Desulfobacter sp.]WDP84678.1 MAG: inorganic pyrophosphatase Ppa [Desulfobacter sp.]